MRLRIMTYNIHRAIGVDRRFRPNRIVRIAEHHAPDILLLQEVDDGVPRSQRRDLGRDLAQDLGFPHFVVGHNVSLRKGRYGNATLSRYPILRERNIDLTIDSRKRRGCQHTTIEIEKVRGFLRFREVESHFETQIEEIISGFQQTIKQRHAQKKKILAFCKEKMN